MYEVLISALAAIIIAQCIKVITVLARKEEFVWYELISTGGMPSSHAAGVTALTLSVYFQEGFSALFVACLIFGMIVVRDAFGIRRQAGEHARIINEMIKDLRLKKKIHHKRLEELLVHTPLQALVGIILGIIVAVVVEVI